MFEKLFNKHTTKSKSRPYTHLTGKSKVTEMPFLRHKKEIINLAVIKSNTFALASIEDTL